MLGRFKYWLIAGLLISNLVMGGISLYYLKVTGQRYEVLLEDSTRPIDQLRSLTRELSAVQRYARRLVDPANEPSWKDLLEQMDAMSDNARSNSAEIARMALVRESQYAENLLKESRAYDRQVDEFLRLARERRFPEANKFNEEVLRRMHDRLQDLIDEIASHVQRQSEGLQRQYLQNSRWFGRVLVAVTGWPLLLAGAAVGAATVLLIGLMVAALTPIRWWQRPSKAD